MRRIVPVTLVAALFIAYGQLAAARGGGGPGGGGGSPHFGGPSANSQASSNSNGRFATDREAGLDRAQDRMSAQGKVNQKATDAVKKKGRSAKYDKAATPATPATPADPGTSPATPATPATPASPAKK